MLTLLLSIALSVVGAFVALVAIWFGWFVVGTIADIREARRRRANERAVWDAIGRSR